MYPVPPDNPDVADPPHAYLPGRTQRHPEGYFETIRETAELGLEIDALTRCLAFRTGLIYLQRGYNWEAHEVLEPVWLALPDASPERRLVQALIQFANANLKYRMGLPKAALRLCGMVQDILAQIPDKTVMGIELAAFRAASDSLAAETKMCNKLHLPRAK